MKPIFFLFSFFISMSLFAQIENLPELEKINGVYKTEVDSKLYPLLLKMHVSEQENAINFKNLIANLKHFEVYDSKKQGSGKLLVENITNFIETNNYQNLKDDIYEKSNSVQKEFIIIKKNKDSVGTATIFAFTTSKDFNVDSVDLM